MTTTTPSAPSAPKPLEQTSVDAAIAEMEAALAALPTETPTGAVPWPMVLVDGEEKAGKSWACAKFTASDKVGRCFWFEYGFEGSAHQYGAIPGARYQIVPFAHFRELMDKLRQVKRIALAARALGEKPVVVIIDTMTAEWKELSKRAEWLARNTKKARDILAQDPHAEITTGHAQWNPVTDLHYELLNLLASIPGIVLLTARGQEVSAFNDMGQPVANKKVWSTKGQKDLAFDCTAWVRMRRGKEGRRGHTEIVAARSVFAGIRAQEDQALRVPEAKRDNALEWLIFDLMKCDPDKAYCRTISRDAGDEDREEERRRQEERVNRLNQKRAGEPEPEPVEQNRAGEPEPVDQEPPVDPEPVPPVEDVPDAPAEADTAPASAPASAPAPAPAAPPASASVWGRVGAAFAALGVSRADQVVLAGELVGRHVVNAVDFSQAERHKLVAELEKLAGMGDGPAIAQEVIGRAREAATAG